VAKDNYRWAVLAIISLYALTQNIALQAMPPVLSLVIKDFGISHAEAGLSMSLCGLPGIFLLLPLSLYLRRIGSKRAGIISIVVTIVGIAITALADNFILFLVGRAIIGIGAVPLPIVGTQVVAQWFARHRLGLAMGIYTIVFPLGAVVALTTFGAIAITFGWRGVVWMVLGLNIIALVLFVMYYKAPAEDPDMAGNKTAIPVRSLFKIGWPIWVLAIMWGLFSLCNNAITTFMPDFLFQNGLDLKLAGTITAIIMILGLFVGPISGFISDRLRYKEAIIVVAALACCVIMFLLPGDVANILEYVVILGIFLAPFAPIIYSIPATMVKHEAMPMAFAAVATCSYIGLFSGPFLTGLIRDVSGSYKFSYWFISLFFLVVAALMTVLMARKIKMLRKPL
jgi:predicted MFS family arabinose efflux permease